MAEEDLTEFIFQFEHHLEYVISTALSFFEPPLVDIGIGLGRNGRIVKHFAELAECLILLSLIEPSPLKILEVLVVIFAQIIQIVGQLGSYE